MMISRFGTGGMMGGSIGMMMMMMMPSQQFIWWTATAPIPVISICTGIIPIISGYSIHRKPESSGSSWVIAILVDSIASLFGMGGFLIGTTLGIIAGILALTRK
jgi:hypothetical protein